MTPGTRIGPYQILGALGAGGMGEVYRARDTKLNRDVALKVLPAVFAADAERLARFTREAHTLAALNHPNIAHIHGLEESPPSGSDQSSVPALVMEFVDGDDLAVRLARGPIPIAEALAIARQIAEALEAAHAQGIVHRDLKPANVKVRPDGTVKVLDFGLAKAMDPAGGSAPATAAPSPTFTAHTHAGMIVGTAAYMAPEQAGGKPVDQRADIWAFGVVCYEMLTGTRLFAGDSVAETLGLIFARDADLSNLPAATPAGLRRVIGRCLQKDPRQRLRDAGDVRLLLDEDSQSVPVAAPAVRRGWLVPVAVAAAAAAGLAIGWTARPVSSTSPATAKQVQLDLLLPPGYELFTVAGAQIAIAPDGSKVAYVGVGGGTRDLFLRALDQPSSVRVRGTDTAVGAAFAPDGQSLVLRARDRTLQRVSLGDGLISLVDPAPGTNAPVWGRGGHFVFARQGLWRMPAAGGTAARLTTLDLSRREVAHTPGAVLPSGVVLFTSWTGDGDQARIESVDPASGTRTVVVDRANAPLFASSGHLLFHRDGAVLAAALDVRTARVTSDATMVIPPDMVRLSGGVPLMALSDTGTLVYAPAQTGLAHLVRVARDGTERRITDAARPYSHPRVSPEGTRVVVEHAADSLWLQDLSRDARTPLTPGHLPGVGFPIWLRDGRRVVYRLFDGLWWVDAGGSGRAERIEGSVIGDIPTAVTPDGETLILLRTVTNSGGDVFALPLRGGGPARPLVQTPGYEGGSDFSPDGRWLVFTSTDSGSAQIYLAPYPAMDRKWPISTGGGTQARWSPTGQEIFYRDGNRMMAVRVDLSGADVRLSAPTMLFEQPFTTGAYITTANYDVTRDGEFVMLRAEPGVPRLTVVLNWTDELRRRLASPR